jgi:hypothetical protein
MAKWYTSGAAVADLERNPGRYQHGDGVPVPAKNYRKHVIVQTYSGAIHAAYTRSAEAIVIARWRRHAIEDGIDRALARLTDQQATALRHRFGIETEPKSLRATAVAMEIAHQNVAKLVDRALRRLAADEDLEFIFSNWVQGG